MSDIDASVIAGLIVLGGWSCIAAPIGLLAHLRMRHVEGRSGAPALPPHELPLLLTAVASTAWPVAAVVAFVAWIVRGWARLGRNVTLVFLLQITGTVLSAAGMAIWNAVDPPRSTAGELFPLVVLASANVAAGTVVATPLVWVWAGRRARRLGCLPPRGDAPGLWRFALYAASLLFWPLGVILAAVFTAPENARVGANAFRCSLVQIAVVALGVCVALPLVVKLVFLR